MSVSVPWMSAGTYLKATSQEKFVTPPFWDTAHHLSRKSEGPSLSGCCESATLTDTEADEKSLS